MSGAWECGENGHAAAVLDGRLLHLFYQARASQDKDFVRWRYGIATFDPDQLVPETLPLAKIPAGL